MQVTVGSYAKMEPRGLLLDEPREQGRPTVDTFRALHKHKKRRGDLSALESMDAGHEEVEDTDPEIAERQRSGHYGETTLRGAEGHLSKAGTK